MSKLKSIFKMKCPRCQEGNFFVSHPYDLKNAGKTYDECPNCGLDYQREPGYYFGALYVSYALGVAIFATIYWSFALFVKDYSVWWPILVIAVASILTGPYLYALSKIIWINMFVKSEKKN
ncbi:MAG: DUF983 domain-containing protein [Crocinitomicaceae bacterium]|jgi:uncharacterized protein (DUF983 family)